MGGPLTAVPVSALREWRGCTWEDQGALVLTGEPATTCYLPAHRAFVRWPAADSEADLVARAEAVLTDPGTEWDSCGTWATDGPPCSWTPSSPGASWASSSAMAGRPKRRPYPSPPAGGPFAPPISAATGTPGSA